MEPLDGFGGRHADRVREHLGWCKTGEGTPTSLIEVLTGRRNPRPREPEPCTDNPLDDILRTVLRRR